MRTTRPPVRSSHQRLRPWLLAGLVGMASLVARSLPADAGCGCAKPPPRAAAVRPNVTYAGRPVTLFNNALVAGQSYDVTFTAMNGATATVRGQATPKRDLADAVTKQQLTVTLPTLPLGPARIKVTAVGATLPLLTVADTTFTVAPQPVALPTAYGSWSYPGSQAAVSRDGVVYLSLDLTGMGQPLVFEAEFAGYPLRFTSKDLVFTNTQGVLMQMLVQPATGEALPGMFVYPATAPTTTSDTLHYSRHEFNTYFLQHQERLPHAVHATDGNWHLDGSPHVDHDHLIVAIIGRLNNGALPAPGATPVFNLKLRAYSLFYQGLVGTSSVTIGGSAGISSYDPGTGATSAQGSIFTNGMLTMAGTSRIEGDAAYASISKASTATITGTKSTVATPMTYMPVKVPAGLPNLGAITLLSGSRTIVGPGSFQVSSILLENAARLYIDNSAGPVTLYVTGSVGVENGARIEVTNPDPEQFAIYVAGTGQVWLEDDGDFVGVIYAPTSKLTMSGTTTFAGAFLGKYMNVSNAAWIFYDRALRGQ